MTALTLAAPSFAFIGLVDAPAPPAMTRLIGMAAAVLPLGTDDRADRNRFAVALDRLVQDVDQSVVLIANGAACRAAAWWSRLSPAGYVERVVGAIMVEPRAHPLPARAAPRDGYASPAFPLPFPSIIVAADAALAAPDLAREWGSALLPRLAGEPRSRSWGARALIDRLTAAVVERDIDRARRLALLATGPVRRA